MTARKMPGIPPQSSCSRRLFVGLAAGVVLVAGGCGRPSHLPELGDVSGTVTLDGRPIARATVSFEPGQGRTSLGTTDAQGRYTLEFAGGYKGAVLGQHTVRIGTGQGSLPDAHGKFVAESVPAAYNMHSTFAADVKPGQNTFTFDLSSQSAGSE
jgi:hypothetical protein